MKTCLIKQPAGLGDILFCQKIAYHFRSRGYRIIWPVVPAYKDISKYIKNFQYPCIEDDFNYKDLYISAGKNKIYKYTKDGEEVVVIPTNNLSVPEDKSIMFRKYALVNLPYADWVTWFNFERNKEKENALYYDVLGLKDDEEYIFVNDYMGTPPDHITKLDLSPLKDCKKINLDFISGYSLFDWCKVVENAQEIHMEGSALTYIAEKLSLKAEILNLYSRNHADLKGIFNQKWKKIYTNKHPTFKDL